MSNRYEFVVWYWRQRPTNNSQPQHRHVYVEAESYYQAVERLESTIFASRWHIDGTVGSSTGATDIPDGVQRPAMIPNGAAIPAHKLPRLARSFS